MMQLRLRVRAHEIKGLSVSKIEQYKDKQWQKMIARCRFIEFSSFGLVSIIEGFETWMN